MMCVIAAGVLLVAKSTGRVLLCKRRKDGFWGVPGGHLERGETAAQAARREFVEETGYRGALRSFQLVRSSRVFALFGAVVPREFSPVLNEEHSRCGWYDPRQHPRPLHSGLDGVVELG